MWALGVKRHEIERYVRELQPGKNIISLPKGSVIFSEGDNSESIFFVCNGTVKLTMSSHAGREVALGVVESGYFVGESCLGGGSPKRSYRAIALSDVTLAKLDRAAMIRLMQTNQEVLCYFLAHLLRSLESLQENLSSGDLIERKQTEQELRAAFDQRQMILNSTKERFFAGDSQWRYTYFNRHAEEQLTALGEDPASLIGRVLWEEFPITPIEETFRRAMRDRVSLTQEDYYPPLGEGVENRVYPTADGGLAIFQQYVTERRRAQKVLRRNGAQLIQRQRLSDTGSWTLNVATGILSWSDKLFRIVGLDPGTANPRYPAALMAIHPEDRLFVQQDLETSIRERSHFEIDCRIVRPDGEIRHIHSIGEPVFNSSGELTDYVGTIINLTERKEAEEKLRESERRFRLLAESIPHHVWSARPDGTVNYRNQRLIDYTGLTVEELRAGGWAAVHPDDVERVKLAWQYAWEHGTKYEVEQRLRGRDGLYRRFVCRGMPVKDEQGRAIGWFGTNTDVEERRRAQDALRLTQAELAHATRAVAVDELTASIAHETNQQLTIIVANANACNRMLASETPDLQEIRMAVQDIAAAGTRAAEVISRIRSLFKKALPEKSPLDMNEIIREVLAMTSAELHKYKISLRADFCPDLPRVLGNRVQLQQVILNLITNAVEAMASVDQSRLLFVATSPDESGNVSTRIADSGPGVTPINAEHIFETFFTTKPHGMGIGLSISRSIIAAHGGRLWAEPHGSGGATFHFTLSPAA